MKAFEFQKERNFDNIIEASFALLRKHFLPMLKIFWKYNAVLIVVFIASNFFVNFLFIKKFANYEKIIIRNLQFGLYDAQTIIVFILFTLVSFVFYLRFYATVMGYIRVYKENDGIVSSEKVKKYISTKFWSLFLLSFIVFILYIIVVVILAFFVGSVRGAQFIFFIVWLLGIIYYAVIITISYPVLFFDDISVFSAFRHAQAYVKSRWWFSFFVLFVMLLILWVLGLVVQSPLYIYDYIKDLLGYSNINLSMSNKTDIPYALLSTLLVIIDYILKTAFLFAVSLLFFSLKEYHTQEGILSKIDQIGQKKEDEK